MHCNKLSEVIPKIISSCDECNYTFIGFKDEKWKGCRNTKLVLKCNVCGKITNKNYDNLVNKKTKCICYRVKKAKEKNVLKTENVFKKINDKCKRYDLTFIGFIANDSKYHNNKTILKLKCNKCGKEVFYTFNHLTNRKNIVCKYCTKSFLESQLKQKLTEKNIHFEEQKRFDWLGRQSLDFYLPEYNIGIECQGIQHFKPIDFFWW